MATLTIQIVAGVQTGGRVKTIDNTVLTTRFIPRLREIFGMPGSTDVEVINEWADRVIRETLDQIKAKERDIASRTAADPIGDVPLT